MRKEKNLSQLSIAKGTAGITDEYQILTWNHGKHLLVSPSHRLLGIDRENDITMQIDITVN